MYAIRSYYVESDQVGYRFYLDWRNGFDIWGKVSPMMMLKKTGLDGFDRITSYNVCYTKLLRFKR